MSEETRPRKREPNAEDIKFIRGRVKEELGDRDLKPWQVACKGFAPFNYTITTRKEWFKSNEFRVATARQILKFIQKMAMSLKKEEVLEKVKMSGVRLEIINGIREVQQAQGIDANLLNSVKEATFKTLVSWADEPSKLEEGLYQGRETLPPEKVKVSKRSRRGRISAKGESVAPLIHLDKESRVEGKNLIIDCAVENLYLHPYQNVSIELDLPDGLVVEKVSPFKWKADENLIYVGFVEAGLLVGSLETEFQITFSMRKAAKSFSIKGKVHYDDTAKGRRRYADIRKATIKV